jgi:hypothetical protein
MEVSVQLYVPGKSGVPFEYVTGWASESVWALWRKDLLPLPGSESRFLCRSCSSLVTIPTEISWLLAFRMSCPRKKGKKTWKSSINILMLFVLDEYQLLGCDYPYFDGSSLSSQ